MEFSYSKKIALSVIMPSLNMSQYIKECLESVLDQTLREIEILCIDAGSTDGTIEILKEYAAQDERIRVIKADKKSYGYQVNMGIAAARGEYIGIVETDDYIDKKMYQTLYSYAADGHPDYIKSGYIPFAYGKKKYECPIDRTYLDEIDGKCINLNLERAKGCFDLNHIWSGIYRREFLLEKDIRLHESPGASYQDVSFSLLVGLLADTAVYVTDSWYHYRLDNSNSSVKSSAKWRCIIEEFQYLEDELAKRRKSSPEIKVAVWKEKLGGYYWNAMRLPPKERVLFLREVREELSQFSTEQAWLAIADENDTYKERFMLLTDSDAMDNHIAEKKQAEVHFRKLLNRIFDGNRFVLVSAGRYGKEILQIQKMLGVRFIEAVADNNAERQGCKWEQYILLSVSEAARQYKDSQFIIANKRNVAELQKQLIDLSIPCDRIETISTMLHIEHIIQLLTVT